MTQAVTFDDVWKMFQEMVRENRERSAETDRKIQEVSAQMRETAREAKETERQAQETERQAQETKRVIQETVRVVQETSRDIKETERLMRESSAETDRVVKEVSKQIGNLGSRWGEFIEGIVAPACEALFTARGIPVSEVHQRVKAKLPGNRHMEIDLLAVNGDTVIPIEVKSRLRAEDVRDFLERLEEFKEFMPRYANARVLGAVAGIVVEEGVDRYAMNKGLFVIVQSGNIVKLANGEEFVPQDW